MEIIPETIGIATIELYQIVKGTKYNWCHIESDNRRVLVGMYEDGKVERQLFNMDKAQVKQLANTLSMLAERMEE